jgi:hypothetical protein
MPEFYQASAGFEDADETIPLSLEEYEDAKNTLQSIIDRGDAAIRLLDNPDFTHLVMEGYLTNEPLRLAELMASGRLNEKNFDNCVQEMKSIANFRTYMRQFTEQAGMAREELKSLEEAREEAILLEEAAAS